VFKLKEAFDPGGIDIVRNGGAAQRNCLSQDTLHSGMQAVEFCPLQVASHPAGPDPCPEETLVGINIPHPLQELLIEQGSLDGRAAGAEERSELVPGNIEGLLASSRERFRFFRGVSMESHASEAARVDKAQLSA